MSAEPLASESPVAESGAKPAPARRLRKKILMGTLAVLGIAFSIFVWEVEWFIIPSGSMAETLRGLHCNVTCADCGRQFSCGTDTAPQAHNPAVCPNCGYYEQELPMDANIDGDRVLVHERAFRSRPPRRWEVVAFRHPDAKGDVYIKRVVGLPGESIQIRDGDVYADGKIARKTLDQQRSMALLVHDGNFVPRRTPQLSERWQGEPGLTKWRSTAGRFFRPAETAAKSSTASEPLPTDWLTYRHWRRTPVMEESPVMDSYGYNQTRTNRDSYPVRDLLLSCRMRTWGEGTLSLLATDGQEQFLVRIDSITHEAVLTHNARSVAHAICPVIEATGEARLEVSLIDRQFVLALDGRPLFVHAFDAAATSFTPTSRPLAIGTQGLGVEVWDMRVFRDVYYTDSAVKPITWGLSQPYTLGKGEFFVLGDNSPLSEDSRYWQEGPVVPTNCLVGKPFLVHMPSRLVTWGWLHFQVPDPERIRYIR